MAFHKCHERIRILHSFQPRCDASVAAPAIVNAPNEEIPMALKKKKREWKKVRNIPSTALYPPVNFVCQCASFFLYGKKKNHQQQQQQTQGNVSATIYEAITESNARKHLHVWKTILGMAGWFDPLQARQEPGNQTGCESLSFALDGSSH